MYMAARRASSGAERGIQLVVEIVTTGTELLLGQIINTNSAYLAAELNKIGFDVLYQSTVGDNRARMEEVLSHALSRADIVITSGGLGPTQGDITKEVTGKLFGRALKVHEDSLKRMKARSERGGWTMTENNLRQVTLPEGALVLTNYAGTAPGVVLEHEGKMIINLPGPPSEVKDMFVKSVKPLLKERFGCKSVIVSRVLNTFGIGESLLEEKIKDLILSQSNPTLALLIRPGEVIIRITAKADTEAEARALIETTEREIRGRVGEFIFAVDDADMEDVVGRMLREKQLTIACAESCTGGLLTSRLTDVAGSSAYVLGSIVSYSNAVKLGALSVPEEILSTEGAVSEEVAGLMAKGAMTALKSDIGVGITGVAGPDGGTDDKPVGLVYIAVAGKSGVRCEKNLFNGTRKAIKYRASQAALDMVRHYIEEL